jgi:hypothetical protein
MDAFVADMTTNWVGVDRQQMSAVLTDVKNKEARGSRPVPRSQITRSLPALIRIVCFLATKARLAKAHALVEEIRTKAETMQTRLRQQLA